MLVPRPRLSLRDVLEEPPPRLPPPPRPARRRLQRRFARGSIAPAYMNVRELAPPSGWSRVERVTLPAPRRDRIAAPLLGGLMLSIATLAVLLFAI